MADPTYRREGNLRFAGIASPGYPEDADALAGRVHALLASQDAERHGPTSILLAMAPVDHPATWECLVGSAITGLARAGGGLVIEDYNGLYALSAIHAGSIAELATCHRRLVDHARSLGYTVRPYWRVSLWRRRLADGNLLPSTETSIFLDRW